MGDEVTNETLGTDNWPEYLRRRATLIIDDAIASVDEGSRANLAGRVFDRLTEDQREALWRSLTSIYCNGCGCLRCRCDDADKGTGER